MVLEETLKFSVLMSVYAGESARDLDNALVSIERQTLRATEFVLVLDGPVPKDITHVIDRFTSSLNIKRVELPVNVGLGEALQSGLLACSYDCIVRCDADDVNRPERFEKLVKLFYKGNFALIGSNIEEFKIWQGDLHRIRKVPEFISVESVRFKLRNPFNHMSVVFSKKAVLSVGGYISLLSYEDYYLWYRLCSRYSSLNIQDVLVDAKTGENFALRRSGKSLAAREIKFLKRLHSENYLNILEFYCLLMLRVLPRIFPKQLVENLYNRYLRHEK